MPHDPPTMPLCAYVVEPEFEPALDAELGTSPTRTPRWPGVLSRTAGTVVTPDPMFARQILPSCHLVKVSTPEALAPAIERELLRQLAPATKKDVAGLFVFTPHDAPYKSCKPALPALSARLKTALARTGHKLLAPDPKGFPPAWQRGALCIQIALVGKTSALVSACVPPALPSGGFAVAPYSAGLAPVPTDKQAPSRAYRKLEETFAWLMRAPRTGETVVDLGGSPGGWAHTALKRGAVVTAVDRSPLLPPAAGHPNLTQVQGDAFAFVPTAPVDWLLCDVICEPARSVDLIARWAGQKWCRNLVVTVKFRGPTNNHLAVQPIVAQLSALGFSFARAKHMHNNHNEVEVFAHL